MLVILLLNIDVFCGNTAIEEALQIAKENGETEAFIIGGGQIYRQSTELWDRIYWTEVDLKVNGDVYFPDIDLVKWAEVSCECHEKDEKNKYNYCFKVLERKEK